jgi:hypothetical protein
MVFPDVEGENLAGQSFVFPRDFSSVRTIVLVAFDFKQRSELETWMPFIDGFARRGVARGRLFPTLPRSMHVMKRVIAATMRKAAATTEEREATIPLFVDVEEFCTALNITERGCIHTFVVESEGLIRAHCIGPYEPSAGAAIEAHLKQPA